MLRTTDPKDIAILYLVTSFAFFLVGGAMALLMRGELAVPGQQFLSNEQYNQLFTMHGTVMLLLYATPILFGFANYILPLQIGSPDVAFPRLNALSYWLFLFGGLTVMSGFLTAGGGADFGWYAYGPAVGADVQSRTRRRPLVQRADRVRTGHHSRCGQHADHDHLPASPGNDDVPDADLLLEHPGHGDPHPDRLPDPHGGVVRPTRGPAPRRPRVRPGQRRRDSLAAPLLVLRAPGGVHRRTAVLRDRHGDHSGVLAQAVVRLQGHDLRHRLDHRPVGRGVGTSHVRDRRGAAPLLLADH